jgi:hypothetical protein
LRSVDCYRAGVEAWHRSHPNQTAAYAGSQAVAINPRGQGHPARRRCVKHRGFNTAGPPSLMPVGQVEEYAVPACADYKMLNDLPRGFSQYCRPDGG